MAVSFVALLKCVVVNGVKVINLMQRVNFKCSLGSWDPDPLRREGGFSIISPTCRGKSS